MSPEDKAPEGKDRTELEREHSRKPEANPGNISEDPEPHHALNNPVGEPDETEWPDPYEKREDPRGKAPAPAPPSTSEPHPPSDKEKLNPVKGDREGG
jgi:hypothetical protein